MQWSLLQYPTEIDFAFENLHFDQAVGRQLDIAKVAQSSPRNLDETYNWVGVHFDIDEKIVGICAQMQLGIDTICRVSYVIGVISVVATTGSESPRCLIVSLHKDRNKWKVNPIVVSIPDVAALEQFHKLSTADQMKLLGL